MAKSDTKSNEIARNKKARFEYEILERMECGIALKGTEVKSLRQKNVSLEEAYVRITSGELWLHSCHIGVYSQAGTENHDPLRPRKLLAHRREIGKWAPRVLAKGLTIVPLNLHFNSRGFAKITIALARGKPKQDKRQSMKKKQHQREIDRAMKRA